MLARNLLRSTAPAARSVRTFATSRLVRAEKPHAATKKDESLSEFGVSHNLAEATSPSKLFGPGTKDPNAQPSSFEISTGIERLELLANMEGIELFDTKPLVQDRKGTPDDPVLVDSMDRVRYIGCTGFPKGSQEVNWIRLEEGKISRDWESGCCYKLNYIGPEDRH